MRRQAKAGRRGSDSDSGPGTVRFEERCEGWRKGDWFKKRLVDRLRFSE